MYNTSINIKSCEILIKTESTAKKFVSKFLRKNRHVFYPYCGSRKFWKLNDGRRRCQRCKMTCHDLAGRWWNKVNLPMDDWLRIVKLFESEAALACGQGYASEKAYFGANRFHLATDPVGVGCVQFLGRK